MWRYAPFVLTALLGSACAPDERTDGPCDRCDEGGGPYMVPVADGRFCLAPAMLPEDESSKVVDAFAKMPLPNLESIQVLAYLSDVAYWNPEEMGLKLEELGFGQPGDGAIIADCARDAKLVRKEGFNLDTLQRASKCANDWAANHPDGSAAAFLKFVDGEVHLERDIEFFSSGYTNEDGEYVHGTTQVFWAKHRTEPWVVIAFRGTEVSQTADLIADVRFPTREFLLGSDWGNVHSGFYDAYLYVADLLQERLVATSPEDRIWVTGHSLGGALASLATADLLRQVDDGAPYTIGGMVTFGSPRVGDTAFFTQAETLAIAHGVPLHRVRNTSNSATAYDPIPHVPFHSTFGEEFRHVGAPLAIYPDGKIEYALLASRGLTPVGVIEDAIEAVKDKVVDILSEAFPHALSEYQERIGKSLRTFALRDLMSCETRHSSER